MADPRTAALSPLVLAMVVLAAIAASRGAPSPAAPSEAIVEAPPPAPRPPTPLPPTPLGRVALPPPVAGAGAVSRLLARIEQGEGPSIEIAWPEGADARERLAAHLTRCAAWRSLLLADGRLWAADGEAGQPWAPARPETVSGLIRTLDGPATDPGLTAAIRARHGLAGGSAVAVVHRDWDARLLAGLLGLAGPELEAAGVVRARYTVDAAGRLAVTAVRLDGRERPGRVDLGPLGQCVS